jgi:hypothetical protein
MGGGGLYAVFVSWAADHPEELSLYPGSLDEPAGRLCNWETAQASEPDGWIPPAGPGWRTAAAEIAAQFPGNDRAIQRLGSCAGPGTQMAACCAWHL